MKIRTKLLLFLLAIALVPLIVSAALHRISVYKLGTELARNQREQMLGGARHMLELLVKDHHLLVRRDRALIELAVRIQAREIELRLAAPPPTAPTIYMTRDFETGGWPPADIAPSEMHYRVVDGKRQPMSVSMTHQACFVSAGVDAKTVAADMARTSTMPQAYRLVRKSMPQVMYWQYTGFESGLHTTYPGHGGLPGDYDPRQRPWYKQAKRVDEVAWTLPIVDASTRRLTLTVAMPVRRPDGSAAGVTAIDVPMRNFFRELSLPPEWETRSEKMMVGFFENERPAFKDKLVIIVQQSYEEEDRGWDDPATPEYLTSDDRDQFEAMLADIRAGRSGLREMRYRGKPSMWCYSNRVGGTALPVVIVPYDAITARADAAEEQLKSEFQAWALVTGLGLALVTALVIALAFRSSRSVTRPIRRLTRAGTRLAAGDYSAQVHIRSRDEFQELGEAFNNIGPKLAERDEMKQSLALAMEIQQHLLPQEAPQLEGFDIAGWSDYCDETGGDYYDFIELQELGSGKLGIAVGDVTGHGIGSALLMASARGVLRSHATLHGDNLAELFGLLNVHLVRDTGDARFMTLFYGVLDADARTLTWVSGGHDPAQWVHASSGEVEELANTGMALGIIEETEFEQAGPVQIEGGDLVVIGTDGIWEARNAARELFGKDRLRDVVRSNAGRTAQEVYDAVVAAVREFQADAAQEDDITLVVIKAL
jgi:phosphoserine phosphatase RsbU/P